MSNKIQVYIIPTLSRNVIRFEVIGEFFEVWSRADWSELTTAHETLWEYYAQWRRYYTREQGRNHTRNVEILLEEKAKLDELAATLVQIMTAYLHHRDVRQSMSLSQRYIRVRHYMRNYFNGGRLHASLHSRSVLPTTKPAQSRPESPVEVDYFVHRPELYSEVFTR